MHRHLASLAGAAILALATPLLAQQEAVDASTVVATVDGTQITLGHMIALRARLPEEYAQMPDEALFEAVREQLVQQQALAARAEGSDAGVELTLQNERRSLLANVALLAALDEAVTEEAVRAAYDERFATAEPVPEYNASHILVESEDEAREIIAEIEAGADFAALARERSTGPSGPNGGELGWFGPGMMVPAFEEAVQSLEAGSVSEPVQTRFGWHVVRLNDQRDQEPPAFETVRPQVEAALRQEAATAAIEQAAAEAEVSLEDVSGIDPSVLSNSDLLKTE
jgi:peptidyl-prolyl cis-trans isomerase C